MTTQQKISDLEGTLQLLKEQFLNQATYSDMTLSNLQKVAKDKHQVTETFFCLGARDFALTLQEKLSQGYEYSDHINSADILPNGNIELQLVKPRDVIDLEYAAIEYKVKSKYQADVADLGPRLIAEIASIQLQIKQLQADLKAEAKQANDYQKMLELVQREFGVDATKEVVCQND